MRRNTSLYLESTIWNHCIKNLTDWKRTRNKFHAKCDVNYVFCTTIIHSSEKSLQETRTQLYFQKTYSVVVLFLNEGIVGSKWDFFKVIDINYPEFVDTSKKELATIPIKILHKFDIRVPYASRSMNPQRIPPHLCHHQKPTTLNTERDSDN